MRIWPGRPYPLGATFDGAGVNFALFSEYATRVELCLFSAADDPKETQRIPLREQTDQVWHCYLPDAEPGQLYGYRIRQIDADIRRRERTTGRTFSRRSDGGPIH